LIHLQREADHQKNAALFKQNRNFNDFQCLFLYLAGGPMSYHHPSKRLFGYNGSGAVTEVALLGRLEAEAPPEGRPSRPVFPIFQPKRTQSADPIVGPDEAVPEADSLNGRGIPGRCFGLKNVPRHIKKKKRHEVPP
jgi:hypothetical protein